MKKMPRILKINKINDDLTVSVVFNVNRGESRIIDFKKILQQPGFEDRPEAVLLKPEEFKKVKLVDYTLSWHNVDQYVTFKGKKMKVPFEMAPDLLYHYSEPDTSQKIFKIGEELRRARKASGLTQEELARLSGTTKQYISRIENNKSSIELATLEKIVTTGLAKQIEVRIK